jgi:hypothetical protein
VRANTLARDRNSSSANAIAVRVVAMRHAAARGPTKWEEALRECTRGSKLGM